MPAKYTQPINRVLCQLCIALVCISISPYSHTETESLKYGMKPGWVKKFNSTKGAFWAQGVVITIFKTLDYNVTKVSRPTKRLPLSLLKEEIDFFDSVGGPSLEGLEGNFVRSKLPLLLSPYFIYYNPNKNWKPNWPPDNVFLKKVGKSVQTFEYLKKGFGLNISRAANYAAPIKMVHLGRIDYYIDNVGVTLGNPTGLLKQSSEDFFLEELFSMPIHIYFKKTKKGLRLKNQFDKSQLRLFQQKLYAKTFFNGAPALYNTHVIDQLVLYINEHFENLNISPQNLQNRQID